MPLSLAVGLFFVLVPTIHADNATATVTSNDGVNLRAGPATSYPVLIVIPFGASVTITGAAAGDNWLPASYNSLTGYVKGDYLSTPGQSSAPPTGGAFGGPAPSASSAATTDIQFATVTPPDGLNLRAGPGTGYDLVLAVPGGTRVQAVGKATADGWYSIVYNGKLGWVDGKYLNFTGALGPASTAAASRFIWPVESRHISTLFSGTHPGIDIDEYPNGGNPVVATAAGTVTFAGGTACCSYGFYVIVKHADGYSSLYGHLSVISVSEGQDVAQGALLGKSGNTGRSTGAHLHFEIRKDGASVNPLALLPGSYVVE